MTDIRIANRSDTGLLPDLCELLKGAVEGGASVGFMAPLSAEAADAYWRDVLASIGQSLMVWVALENGRAIGSVQLALCQRGNGRHRGEVQKLLVLGTHRRRGIAQRLMGELEASARAAGRSLLVLDTQRGPRRRRFTRPRAGPGRVRSRTSPWRPTAGCKRRPCTSNSSWPEGWRGRVRQLRVNGTRTARGAGRRRGRRFRASACAPRPAGPSARRRSAARLRVRPARRSARNARGTMA